MQVSSVSYVRFTKLYICISHSMLVFMHDDVHKSTNRQSRNGLLIYDQKTSTRLLIKLNDVIVIRRMTSHITEQEQHGN